MKKFITILLIVVLQTLSAQKKPNVLFIVADLGINALNCYGNNVVESPNTDKLYNEGMHFTNAYSKIFVYC